jgi:hypothetical protein
VSARAAVAFGAAIAATALALDARLAAQQLRSPPPELPADWAERDLEGKWVAYRRDCEAHVSDADRRTNWGRLLGERGEFELLEWIGIYEGWRYAGGPLAARNAPSLFRVALWNLAAYDSHNKDNARKVLESRANAVLGWLDKYPEARRGRGAELVEKLRASGEPADPGAQLPPLDPVQFLVPQLDAPAELAEFGDRKTAEPGVRYVHQVVRALDGLLVWGEVSDMHVPKVLALAHHGELAVRTAAWSTLTKMPGELLPVEPLVAAADGESEPASRRLATLAMSYSAHPRAAFETLRIAADARHAGSDVALLRLGELADPYLLALMQELQTAAGGRDAVAAAVDKTQRRLAGLQLADVPQTAMTWVERVAWLRATGDPRAARATAVLGQALRDRLPGDALRDALLPQTKGPLRAQFRGDERAKMEEALKSFLRELGVK